MPWTETETSEIREPKLGEMLRCGICGSEVRPIDEDWIEKHYNKIPNGEKHKVYNPIDDSFLSYCGCEERAHWGWGYI